MKRIAFLSRILATSILLCAMAGLGISAKPAMNLKQEKSGSRLGEEINRIRRQADSILEKEDDAEQKVILLLQNERVSETGKKKSQAAKIAVLHSLSAQSILEYYRRFGFGIGESDFAKPNIQQAVPDYSRLENWRFNDFKQEILQQIEASRQTAFIEPDKQLIYGAEGLAILDSNRNTYCPDLKEILCHRALQILRDMESSGLLQEKERIEKTEEVYRYLENHISCKRGEDSLQARFDLELRYLYYRHNSRLCNEKEYGEQLSELASRYKDLPNAGDALYLLACLKKDDAPFVAERYAREAMERKGCWGAEKSKELLRSLLSPALNISTASVQLPYQAVPLWVEEKNCAGFDYQIYRLNEEEVVNYQFCHDPKKFTDKLTLKSKPASSGHIDLPIANENLQMHSGTVALPALAPGFYLLKVQTDDIRYKGNDSSFRAKELSSILFFQVSQTAFLCYPEKEQKWNGLLLDRKSGLPLQDLAVEAFFVDYDYTRKSNCLQLRYRTETDRNGFFQIDSTAMQKDEHYTNLLLRFTNASDTLWFEKYSRLTLNRPYPDRRQKNDTGLWTKVQDIFFFNNLPVYRPGDSLLIKALVVLKEGGNSFVATDFPAPIAITLRNPDGERQGGGQFSVNRDGIAHIALKIPQDAKAGQWTVQTAGHIATCFIEVENYKRANFSVELAGPSSVNAQDSCIVTGKAMYFSGEAVRAGTANYRIYASTSFFRPSPYFRRYPHHRELIDQGHANTNNNGEFTIPILPEIPDLSSGDFRFYEIECELSDRSGETQTASLMLPIRQKPVLSAQFPEMLISDGKQWLNQSGMMQFFLNGETNDTLWRDMRTEVQFFRLSDTLEHSSFADGLKYSSGDALDQVHYIDEATFKKLLPHEAYFSLKERDSLAVFTPMLPSLSSLSENGNCTLPADMPAGCYEYRINAYTANNDTLSLKGRFYVVKTNGKLPGELGQDGFFLTSNTEAPVYSKNKKIELYVGNPSSKPILINFHLTDIAGCDLSFSRSIESGCHKIELPPHSLSKQGNWSLSSFCQTQNHSFFHSYILTIPQEKKEMEISGEPLPDRIGSGENIRLHFTIKPSQGRGEPKPLILSMYDASLDMLAPGNAQWPTHLFEPLPYPQNAWNMAMFGGGDTYGIQTSDATYPYYAESGLPGFNARLSWKGLYPVRFNRFLMKNAVMDCAAPAMGNMARAESVQTEETAVDAEYAANGSQAEAETGIEELLPRNDFRPDIFFALAECLPDGNAYSANFSFRAPDYFGRFRLRAFAYSKNLYAGNFQTYVTVQKPVMLYPQLPRFLRERDSITLKCRYIASSLDFENTNGLQAQCQIRILAEDRSGSTTVLAEKRTTTVVQALQGSMQTSLRIPENCRKLNVEYRIVLFDQAGQVLATDAVSDSVPVLENHIQVNEFMPFSIRQGEKKTIKSAFVLPADSIRFSFSGDPYRIVSEQLHDMEFDSCKTALSAAWKMTGYYMCGKDWKSVWPVLSDFAKKKGGFGWIRESEASYFITMQVMSALSMIPKEELMQLQNMRSVVQNALKFLYGKVSENFEADTLHRPEMIPDDKVGLLYLLSCWSPYSDFMFRNPAILYYTDLAKQCSGKLSLQSQALLLRYFIARKNMGEAEKILSNLNRLALYDKEWGMYWKRENLGGSTGRRVRCMADLACAYMEFSHAVENENPKRSDTLSSQYREILNWMLNMQQTVDFRSGNGSGITTADLVRQAAAFAPKKALSRQMAEKLVSEQTTEQGLVRVQIGKQKFESDTSIFSFNVEPPQTESFKNKTTVEWVGSNSHQVGYGSIKATSTQEMNSIEPQQDKSGLRIERRYRDLYDTTAKALPSHEGLRFESGKRIRVSLEIQADRDFSYIRLRSLRPSGLEWVSTQSGYGFGNGLLYYKDVDDQGVDYFIEFLPKGRYLLHYELKADTEGIFTDGPASIESDFNEGFGGHSGSGIVICDWR